MEFKGGFETVWVMRSAPAVRSTSSTDAGAGDAGDHDASTPPEMGRSSVPPGDAAASAAAAASRAEPRATHATVAPRASRGASGHISLVPGLGVGGLGFKGFGLGVWGLGFGV